MTEPSNDKDAFLDLLRPITAGLAELEFSGPGAAAAVEAQVPWNGDVVAAVRDAAVAAVGSDWLLRHENGGVRYGRVAKDLDGFSVDAVLMSTPGPKHRHPNGEVDLLFPLSGEPEFDGHAPGWVVYGPGSVHVPTVKGGEMLILYFLPGGAIEFL